MNKIGRCFFIFAFFLRFSAWADSAALSEFHEKNFGTEYAAFLAHYDEVKNSIPKKYWQKQKRGRVNSRLPKKIAQKRRELSSMDLLRKKYDPVWGMSRAFIAEFVRVAEGSSYDREAMEAEATHLAFMLVDEVHRLKKKYKSFFIPILHNAMIDAGIRDRGACKHWAEDLLKFLRPIERKYFSVTWGEANAEKMNEHNIAVVMPVMGTFDDGVMVDPWRTSGKPFWLRVTKDDHYKWSQWPLYGVY